MTTSTMMAVKSEICIIGAGISGLVLGRCLQANGIKPIIFEKARKSVNRNRYGITLHHWAYAPLLKMLRMDVASFPGQLAVDAMSDGRGLSDCAPSDPAHRVNRAKFEHMLTEGLDIRYEHQLDKLEKTSEQIELTFTNKVKHHANILVGADGVHSQVRQFISPETEFKVLPYAVLNGKRRMKPVQYDEQLSKFMDDKTILEHRSGDALFSISIDEKTHEQISISYNFSRHARRDDDPLFRPGRSKTDATKIPPEFFDEIGTHKLEAPYQFVFNPDAMKDDRLLNWLMRSLIVKHDTVTEEANARIVLIGEAVHAEPILGGLGANEAIQDGMMLAQVLADKRPLTEFYDSRYDAWRSDVAKSEQRIGEMHGMSKHNL